MENAPVQSANNIEKTIQTYGDMLFRLCLVMLGNASDAEDAVQETFIKYFRKAPEFKDAGHEKAWLIRVSANKCKDMLRYRNRHMTVNIDEIQEIAAYETDSGILDALMTLPEKYRIVLMLYYVEGYKVSEIAKIVGKTSSAVKMRLQKGRKLLEETYRKEYVNGYERIENRGW